LPDDGTTEDAGTGQVIQQTKWKAGIIGVRTAVAQPNRKEGVLGRVIGSKTDMVHVNGLAAQGERLAR
jgi:hypothetical protein